MIIEEEYLEALQIVKDYEKQFNISAPKCSCKQVKNKDENNNRVILSPWCWKCNT